MKSVALCLINLLVFVSAVTAEQLLVEGHVRLPDGQPVVGAQVMLIDWDNLRRGAVARATTDAAGRFALPSQFSASAGSDFGELSQVIESFSQRLGRSGLPNGFALGANYPNPFNPATVIPYELAAGAHVRLEVFNLLGQRVATLVNGYQAAGSHTATWTATNAAGQAVSAGVYLYRLTAGSAAATGRMVLVDGQAGVAAAVGPGRQMVVGSTDAGERSYGLAVSGAGLVPYVDGAFALASGPVEVVVEPDALQPRGKRLADEGVDLAVDSLWVARSKLMPGKLFALNVRLLNQGTDPSDSTMVDFYLSNNSTISTADTQIDSAWVGGLAAADTSEFSIDLTAPLRLATHWIGACVEAVDNNCSDAVEVTVAHSADLVASAALSSGIAGQSNNIFPQGQSFTLSAMIGNQGTIASDSTIVHYYVSADSTIGVDDTEVGTALVDSVGVDATSKPSIALSASWESGTYYYGACVASVEGEYDADNNCSNGVRVLVYERSSVSASTAGGTGGTGGTGGGTGGGGDGGDGDDGDDGGNVVYGSCDGLADDDHPLCPPDLCPLLCRYGGGCHPCNGF